MFVLRCVFTVGTRPDTENKHVIWIEKIMWSKRAQTQIWIRGRLIFSGCQVSAKFPTQNRRRKTWREPKKSRNHIGETRFFSSLSMGLSTENYLTVVFRIRLLASPKKESFKNKQTNEKKHGRACSLHVFFTIFKVTFCLMSEREEKSHRIYL